MEITKVTVRKLNQKKNNLKAFATVELDEELVLTGIKLIKGSKGLFIGMPSTYAQDRDEYYDIFFPVTAEFRTELQEAIIDAYNEDNDGESKKSKSKSKSKSRKSKVQDDDDDEEDD